MDYAEFTEITRKLTDEQEFHTNAHLLPTVPANRRLAFISNLENCGKIGVAAHATNAHQFMAEDVAKSIPGDNFSEIAD